jgi:hypothetical protein
MKFSWQDTGRWAVTRWILFVYACLLALYYIPNLPYHNGAYYPFFASAILAATCFGIGRRFGKIQFYLGLFFLVLPTSFMGGNF